jgi:hypothetical protein
MTPPVAERELELVSGTGRQRVTLRIGTPVETGDHEWRCPVEFIGSGERPPPPGLGVDSLQALIHAIAMARFYLDLYERQSGGRFFTFGEPGHDVPMIPLDATSKTDPGAA